MIDELKEIGLSENEALIYLSLIKSPKQPASQIAKDSKINRSVVYSLLDRLVDKGLVSYILISNVKHFLASSPELLKDFIKNKEYVLSKILPGLKSMRKETGEILSVEVYEGAKGGLAILKDIIKEKKDYVSFGDNGNFSSILGTIAEQYIRQLNERKITERILVKKGVKLKDIGKKTEVKYLPKEFDFPTITTIYGNKIAIAILEKPYYVVLIKSSILAYTYNSLFEGLWKIAKK